MSFAGAEGLLASGLGASHGVSIMRPSTAPATLVSSVLSSSRGASVRMPKTPRRHELEQERARKAEEAAYDDAFKWVFDLEFTLQDCNNIFGSTDAVLGDSIATHEFAVSLAHSVAGALGLSPSDIRGVMRLGVGSILHRIPTGPYRPRKHLLVQIRTETPGDRADDGDSEAHETASVLRSLLEDAVDDGDIRGAITLHEGVSESFSVSIGAVSIYHRTASDGPRQKRPSTADVSASSRAPALSRSQFPSFCQHSVRVVMDDRMQERLNDLKMDRRARVLATTARREQATRAREASAEKQRRREERNREEARRIAERKAQLAEQQQEEHRAHLMRKLAKKQAVQAEEKRKRQQEREDRAAEKVARDALREAARERAKRIAVLEEEARRKRDEDRNTRTEEARQRTLMNIQEQRDAAERLEALQEYRREAEWQMHCRKVRQDGTERRAQGRKAIEWGGTDEARAQQEYAVQRNVRTDAARKRTLKNIEHIRTTQMEELRLEFARSDLERRDWEAQLRRTNSENLVLGREAIARAQEEKVKIDAQNARYAEGRARIDASKKESKKRLEEKRERDREEQAAKDVVEKGKVSAFRQQREQERRALRLSAQRAAVKEARRVARQDVRRAISKLQVPRCEDDWSTVVSMLSQGDRINSQELDFFCSGPKHRSFVKWYRDKYVEGDQKRKEKNERAWIPKSEVCTALHEYCVQQKLPKEASKEEEASDRQQRQATSPTRAWIPAGSVKHNR